MKNRNRRIQYMGHLLRPELDAINIFSLRLGLISSYEAATLSFDLKGYNPYLIGIIINYKLAKESNFKLSIKKL